ncbi:MAG: amidohydrolase family protein [Butyricicoccaceae bacterium]
MVIDFHTHTFPDKIAARTITKLKAMARAKAHTDATCSMLVQSMQEAGVDASVILPVATNVKQSEKLNEAAYEVNARWYDKGLISFGGIHPAYGDYRALLQHIVELGLKGIKLHPQYQGIPFDDIRTMRIIDRASELGLIVIVHAGIDIGIEGPTLCTPDSVLHVMEKVAPDKLVLAHMGGWRMWGEVADKLAGLPLYLDTSYSLGMIPRDPDTPRRDDESALMGETEFTALIRKQGADRVLLGTDSPWGGQKETLAQIRALDLTDEERTMILGENAQKLLRMV